MKTLKKIFKSESYIIGFLLLFTLVIIVLQTTSLERSFTVDLNTSNKISARDDRPFKGSSIGSFKQVPEGIEFNCQVIKEALDWPYCELVIDLREVISSKQGHDFSQYERVGLWLQHDHENQPGTRFELHNFNPEYSTLGIINSLKYNSIEFTEKQNQYPTWINLHSFNVPTWWNARNALTLEHFGTDFTNIHTLGIATGGLIEEGMYKLVIEKIEFRGKYFKTTTLFFLLIIVWSVATGYFFQRFNFIRDDFKYATQEKLKWERRASTDPLTGALNRSTARGLFKNITKNKISKVSLIFLDIDHFKQVNDTYGHNVGDDVLIQFVNCINANISEIDKLIRWGGEEFLIICIDTELNIAIELADQIRSSIENSHWSENIKLTTSIGVAQLKDETITKFIERADRALYKAKQTGRNRVVASS
jgi:diguanylate cyclase (GGDEF)-like protein